MCFRGEKERERACRPESVRDAPIWNELYDGKVLNMRTWHKKVIQWNFDLIIINVMISGGTQQSMAAFASARSRHINAILSVLHTPTFSVGSAFMCVSLTLSC